MDQRNIGRRPQEVGGGLCSQARESMGFSCVTVVLSYVVKLQPYVWISLSKYCAVMFYLPVLNNKPFLFLNFLECVALDVEVSGVRIRFLLLINLMNKWDFCGHLLVFK